MRVFCLQETHGNRALLDKHFRLILRDYWAFHTFGKHNSGGIVTFVSKQIAPSFESVELDPIVEGRVLKNVIRGSAGYQILYNVHNFGLESAGMKSLCQKLRVDIANASENQNINPQFSS